MTYITLNLRVVCTSPGHSQAIFIQGEMSAESCLVGESARDAATRSRAAPTSQRDIAMAASTPLGLAATDMLKMMLSAGTRDAPSIRVIFLTREAVRRAFPDADAAAAAVAALLCNLSLTWRHDTEGARYRGFVAGLEQVVGPQRSLLLYCEDPVPGPDAHVDGLAAVRVFAPETESWRLGELAAAPPERVRQQLADMAAALPTLTQGARAR